MSFIRYCLFSLMLVTICIPTSFSLALPPAFIEAEALDAMRASKKMSEFIKSLGIPNEGLCHPGTEENLDPMFNEELSFGDLIMDEEEKKIEYEEKEEEEEEEENIDENDVEDDFAGGASSQKPKPKKRAKKPKKWPNGIIPYYISNDYNSKQRQKIKNVIRKMNSMLTSVYYRPVNKFDKNYVMIFSGKGCYANLGMKGGQQPISLQADNCLSDGTIQHELMHVLGFRHEQNRPDRDYYIEIMYENIPEKWHKDYKRYRTSEDVYVGTYDYYSVLHYPPEAPKSNGKKRAFRILDDSVDIERIGLRNKISLRDLAKAEELYSDL